MAEAFRTLNYPGKTTALSPSAQTNVGRPIALDMILAYEWICRFCYQIIGPKYFNHWSAQTHDILQHRA